MGLDEEMFEMSLEILARPKVSYMITKGFSTKSLVKTLENIKTLTR